MRYNTRQFTVNKAEKTFVAEKSDLGVRAGESAMGRVFQDAYDYGLFLVSHNSGREATFVLSGIEYDRDNDIRWWTLHPSADTLRQIPQLCGWKMVLFND